MQKEIINSLVFLSYEGYQKTHFVEDDNIYVVKIDCADMKTKQDCFEIFGDRFDFPSPVGNWAAFSDWMRYLVSFEQGKAIRLELMNYDHGFDDDSKLQYTLLSVFTEEILPFWEHDVTRVTSGSRKPRQFDVYCIMSPWIDW